jgi:Phytanoyl-CoA dioxygenase (PhyH)
MSSISPKWIQDWHRQHLKTHGYMAIRNVVPTSIVNRAVGDIAAFVGADLARPSTWYGGAPQLDGIVPLHHAQSLWDIRQNENLYQAFREFFGTPHLMVDIDRCLFRPPVNAAYPTVSQATMHRDTDPRVPGPGVLQGVVLLSDVAHNGGGFHCIPEVYQNLTEWLAQYATGPSFDYFNPGLKHWIPTQVEGRSGDVIIWSTKLPHGSAMNALLKPRIAAFVTMQPPAEDLHLRESMKSWWQTKRAPAYWRGLPGQMDPEPGAPAVLTELGRQLIGELPGRT